MPAHPRPTGRPADHAHSTGHGDGVYRITAAPTSLTDDLGVRYRKYVISMVIRTACFLIFVFLEHWTRWLFVAGAVFLPYVAVVLANAGRESRGPRPESFDITPPRPLDLPAIEARITEVRPREPGDAHPGGRTAGDPGGARGDDGRAPWAQRPTGT
ncbi:DUF3099 domain-containing protein [Kineococcus terrestris]|uniref:DUF3099 domain-containing protein n=1 Tax=Kineococcus terrestris TaxID=2044856 RepID=UPI0034DADF85